METSRTFKAFNLEEAKAGKPIQTKGGFPARVLEYNRKTHNIEKMVVLVDFLTSDEEKVYYYTTKGEIGHPIRSPILDLVMVQTKKRGWVNLYSIDQNDKVPRYITGYVFSSLEEAKKRDESLGFRIGTCEIDWEE